MKTIKGRLIFSYSFFSIVILLSLALFYTVSMENVFSGYAKEQLDVKMRTVVEQMKEVYQKDKQKYETTGVEIIGNAALQNGLLVRLQTLDGELDWDIRTHKEAECQLTLQHAESNMHSRYLKFEGSYQEKEYLLESDGAQTGKLTIGYYGPYSYTDGEIRLLGTLNRFLILLSGIFIFVAVILGVIMSKKLTKPISDVTRSAAEISKGKFGVQIQGKGSIEETQSLITAINEMSATLEKEEIQKRQISSDVAHELRTPLTNLQLHLEAMLDGIWEPTTERLESCYEEILRLIHIVRQLQELYVLENQRELLRLESFDFSSLCEKLCWSFEPKLQEKNLQLTLCTRSGDMLYGDRQRIQQCMTNLVANAIKYAETGSSIRIIYKQMTDSVLIQVQNKGNIIPEDALEHLFERFYRVDKSRNTKTGGMGIGLSITKAIVERHNGRIWASSDETNGTVFSIELPK